MREGGVVNNESEYARLFRECQERARKKTLLYVLCSFKRKMKQSTEYTIDELEDILKNSHGAKEKESWQNNGKRKKPRIK